MGLTLALVASYCWLAFGGARELVYFQVPLAGLLSQIGGTWKKQFRRIGIPTMLTISTIGFLGWNWWWILIWPVYFGFSTLPFTLPTMPENKPRPIDYVWFFTLGILAWLCSIIFALATNQIQGWLILSFWTIIGYSIPGVLSNIKGTASFFEWKLCEAFFWSSTLIQACCLISWAQ